MRESHHTFIAKWKLDTLSVKFLQDAQRLLAEQAPTLRSGGQGHNSSSHHSGTIRVNDSSASSNLRWVKDKAREIRVQIVSSFERSV